MLIISGVYKETFVTPSHTPTLIALVVYNATDRHVNKHVARVLTSSGETRAKCHEF